MRPARSLALYLLWVFGVGPLLAPVAYWGIQAAAREVPSLAGIAGEPFHRYLNRCLLGMALAGTWPLMRSLGMGTWSALGLWGRGQAWRWWGMGFALGFGSLAMTGVVAIALGGRTLNTEPTMAEWVGRFLSALASAGVVSVLEEVLFRGAIFGGFLRAYSFRTALAVSSMIFALVHFMARPASPDEVRWWSGFTTLGAMLEGLAEPWRLLPGLVNLLGVGLLLAVAYHRAGSLFFPIGIHAGWILWGKIYAYGTRLGAGSDSLVWGSGRVFDGWLALIVLACVAPVLHYLTRSEVECGLARARVVDAEPGESMD